MLFTYLMTTKIDLFKSITAFNTNFQITVNKSSTLDKILPAKLRLIVYFHRIETKYPNFTNAQKLLALTNTLKLSKIIAKLEKERRQTSIVEITELFLELKIKKR